MIARAQFTCGGASHERARLGLPVLGAIPRQMTGQLKVCRTWMMKLWVGGKPLKRSARTTSRAVASQQLEQ